MYTKQETFDMVMYTKQETFDMVVRGLASQGWERSVGVVPPFACSGTLAEGCAYRGDLGRRCAAGHLIPDDIYSTTMEGLSAIDHDLRLVFERLGHDPSFVRALQVAHDSALDRDEVRANLMNEAAKHGLTWPEGL